MQVRPQAIQRVVPLRSRLELLNAVVKPSLLWGFESLSLTKPQRRQLTAVQRSMVKKTLLLLRRPAEAPNAYFRRRERLVTHIIKTCMRASWGDVQRYRHFTFLGHVMSMSPDRYARKTAEWRDLEWWGQYGSHPLNVQTASADRRRKRGNIPCRPERGIAEAFQAWLQSPTAVGMLEKFVAVTGRWPTTWKQLATDRELFREFARQSVWPPSQHG